VSDSGNPLVEAVKKHALENYEASFGWSEVIECYSDDDIANLIETACTPLEAIEMVGQVVGVRDERYRDAVGPEITCPECGTRFGENTACPNWQTHPKIEEY
jgi:hypothetical protein